MFKHLNYSAVNSGFLRFNGPSKEHYHASHYSSLPFMITIFSFSGGNLGAVTVIALLYNTTLSSTAGIICLCALGLTCRVL